MNILNFLLFLAKCMLCVGAGFIKSKIINCKWLYIIILFLISFIYITDITALAESANDLIDDNENIEDKNETKWNKKKIFIIFVGTAVVVLSVWYMYDFWSSFFNGPTGPSSDYWTVASESITFSENSNYIAWRCSHPISLLTNGYWGTYILYETYTYYEYSNVYIVYNEYSELYKHLYGPAEQISRHYIKGGNILVYVNEGGSNNVPQFNNIVERMRDVQNLFIRNRKLIR